MRASYLIRGAVIFYTTVLLFCACREKPKQRDQEKDRLNFVSKLEHYSILEEIAMDAMEYHDSIPKDVYERELGSIALENWVECVNLMDEAAELELSTKHQHLREKLTRYANLRINQVQLLLKERSNLTADYTGSIDSIQNLLSNIKQEILQEEGGFKDTGAEPLETL